MKLKFLFITFCLPEMLLVQLLAGCGRSSAFVVYSIRSSRGEMVLTLQVLLICVAAASVVTLAGSQVASTNSVLKSNRRSRLQFFVTTNLERHIVVFQNLETAAAGCYTHWE